MAAAVLHLALLSACSDDSSDCWSSRCCASPGRTCFARRTPHPKADCLEVCNDHMSHDCSQPHGQMHSCLTNYSDQVLAVGGPSWQEYSNGLKRLSEAWVPLPSSRINLHPVVLGSGFGTTATSSLAAALNLFNLTVVHGSQPILLAYGARPISDVDDFVDQMHTIVEAEGHGRYNELDYRLLHGVDALLDEPSAAAFLDFWRAHPRATVAHSTRDGAEWIRRRRLKNSANAPVYRPSGRDIRGMNNVDAARLFALHDSLVRCVVPADRLFEVNVWDTHSRETAMQRLAAFRGTTLDAHPELPRAYPYVGVSVLRTFQKWGYPPAQGCDRYLNDWCGRLGKHRNCAGTEWYNLVARLDDHWNEWSCFSHFDIGNDGWYRSFNQNGRARYDDAHCEDVHDELQRVLTHDCGCANAYHVDWHPNDPVMATVPRRVALTCPSPPMSSLPPSPMPPSVPMPPPSSPPLPLRTPQATSPPASSSPRTPPTPHARLEKVDAMPGALALTGNATSTDSAMALLKGGGTVLTLAALLILCACLTRRSLTRIKKDSSLLTAGSWGACFQEHRAAAFALGVMVTIGVTKTLLTKLLFVHVGQPVAFSVLSCLATILCILPVFLAQRVRNLGVVAACCTNANGGSSYCPLRRQMVPGFAALCVAIAVDLACTNVALDLLAVPLQQTIKATSPTATILLESVIRRKLHHPAIYVVVVALCLGPIIIVQGRSMGGAEHAGPTSNGTHHGVHERDSSFLGVCMMLIAVLGGAFKYVFAHATIKKYREELGVLAFTLWVEVFVGAMLLPWALINGELQTLLGSDHSIGDWVLLWGAAAYGGLRIYSQFTFLALTSATSLAASNLAIQALTIILAIMAFGTEPTAALILGIVVTLSVSALYTALRSSHILERQPTCSLLLRYLCRLCQEVPTAGVSPWTSSQENACEEIQMGCDRTVFPRTAQDLD